MTVTARDAAGNVATSFRGLVALETTDPREASAIPHTFTAEDNGVHTFTGVTIRSPGSHAVRAVDMDTLTIEARSAPIAVSVAGPASP